MALASPERAHDVEADATMAMGAAIERCMMNVSKTNAGTSSVSALPSYQEHKALNEEVVLSLSVMSSTWLISVSCAAYTRVAWIPWKRSRETEQPGPKDRPNSRQLLTHGLVTLRDLAAGMSIPWLFILNLPGA
jgi:hypothetical protein